MVQRDITRTQVHDERGPFEGIPIAAFVAVEDERELDTIVIAVPDTDERGRVVIARPVVTWRDVPDCAERNAAYRAAGVASPNERFRCDEDVARQAIAGEQDRGAGMTMPHHGFVPECVGFAPMRHERIERNVINRAAGSALLMQDGHQASGAATAAASVGVVTPP